jgi:hypothetical protein
MKNPFNVKSITSFSSPDKQSMGILDDYKTSRAYFGPTSPKIIIAAANSPLEKKNKSQYVCDGVNDNVEIQAAIDSLEFHGGVVELMEGIYYINHAIDLSAGNITLQGEGLESTILRAQINSGVVYASNMIELLPTTDVYFTCLFNLCVDGRNALTGHGFYAKYNGGACKDTQIREVFFIRCGEDGIHIESGWGLKITDCISEYNKGIGIYIDGSAQAYVLGTFIAYNEGSCGLFVNDDCYNININCNVIYKNKYNGVEIEGDYCTIIGNSFDGNGQTASSDHILLDVTSQNCIISGNSFRTGTGTISENINDDGTNNSIGHNSDVKGATGTLYSLSGAIVVNGIITSIT